MKKNLVFLASAFFAVSLAGAPSGRAAVTTTAPPPPPTRATTRRPSTGAGRTRRRNDHAHARSRLDPRCRSGRGGLSSPPALGIQIDRLGAGHQHGAQQRLRRQRDHRRSGEGRVQRRHRSGGLAPRYTPEFAKNLAILDSLDTTDAAAAAVTSPSPRSTRALRATRRSPACSPTIVSGSTRPRRRAPSTWPSSSTPRACRSTRTAAVASCPTT